MKNTIQLLLILLLVFAPVSMAQESAALFQIDGKEYGYLSTLTAAMDDTGTYGLVAVWDPDDTFANSQLQIIPFKVKGNKIKGKKRVTIPGLNQRVQSASVAWDTVKQQFLVVWGEYVKTDAGERGRVFGRFFDKKGKPAGAAFLVLKDAFYEIIAPRLTALGDGNNNAHMYLTFSRTGGYDAGGKGVFVNVLGSNGKPVGSPVQLSSFGGFGEKTIVQAASRVMLLENGNLFVLLQDDYFKENNRVQDFYVTGLKTNGSILKTSLVFSKDSSYQAFVALAELSEKFLAMASFHAFMEFETSMQLVKTKRMKKAKKPKTTAELSTANACAWLLAGKDHFLVALQNYSLQLIAVNDKGRFTSDTELTVDDLLSVNGDIFAFSGKGGKGVVIIHKWNGSGLQPYALLFDMPVN